MNTINQCSSNKPMDTNNSDRKNECLTIGRIAPDFTALSTQGPVTEENGFYSFHTPAISRQFEHQNS